MTRVSNRWVGSEFQGFELGSFTFHAAYSIYTRLSGLSGSEGYLFLDGLCLRQVNVATVLYAMKPNTT